MSRKQVNSKRSSHKLRLWVLEARDLPHSYAPMAIDPLQDGFVETHAAWGDPSLQAQPSDMLIDGTPPAMGPFYIAPWQLNQPPIMADAPFGGPDGPLSPNPITYTTDAAGLPQLSSSPSSPVNIYLDFDGYSDGTTTYTPYDSDSNAAAFGATEQAVIVEAWRQISVYYSMYDVNVTTVYPTTGPKVWQLISNSISGGYAYVGAFPNSIPRGFNQSSDARGRLSGITHEIGHNFGNSHQSDFDALGAKTNEYSSGWTLHGPIMGVDFAQNAHKFITGHPSGSNVTTQDDMAVIANRIKSYQAVGGDGYRLDEHGNTIATATTMESVDGYFRGWGTIERLTDADVFTFTSTGGRYNLTANTDTPSALNVKLEVFDAAGSRLATADGPNNDQLASTSSYDRDLVMDLPAGTYYLSVSGHGDYADMGAYDVSARPLPTGWNTQSIGTVIAGGYAGVNPADSVWRLGGSGSDIWSTSDNFRYAYLPLTGDGSITARVTSLENTDANAKAGVMIRESIGATARNAYMMLKPSGAYYQYRTSTGGSTTSVTAAGTPVAPYWVRLTRTGNSIKGEISADGSTWSTVSTQTVSMASQVLIGLAVTSHNTSAVNVLADATFDNVSTTGNTSTTAPTYNSLDAPTNLALNLGVGTAINLVWDAVPGATGYAVDRSVNGVNWTQIGTTAAGSPNYGEAGMSGGLRYFYRVSAQDASGRSIPSAAASIINRPSAPTLVTTMSPATDKIVIDWRDAGGETGYRIERSSDSINWSSIATVGLNVPSYTNTGLTANTTYQYRIIPLSAAGDGPTSAVVTESTRLPAITGLAFTSLTSSSVGFHWLPQSNVTGYRVERSTDGTTFTTLATVPVVNYVDSTVSAGNEYYYRVTAINAYSESISQTTILVATPTASTPPVPWESQDVGTVGGAGVTKYSSGTFTVIGSGSNIAGTSDSFRMTSQLLIGDGSIFAKVATVENIATAKAGVMFRESTAANARMAALVVTPSAGIQWITRTLGGATAISTTTASLVAPYWVRIDRAGNVFTAYISPDNVTWSPIGSPTTIVMTTNARAGLVVSANDNTKLNTSTFTNVTVTQGDIAPAVFSSTPTGRQASPVSAATLVFNEAMDTTSFDLTDLLSFTGPGGNLKSYISGFNWTNSQTLQISFATQSVAGDYSLSIGSQVLSQTGQALDQNRDGVVGGASDTFTVNFRLGGVAADGDGYVYATTTFNSALNLTPGASGVNVLTAISNADEAAAAIDLGANVFRLHNSNYTGTNQLFVSSNGHITFGSSDTTSANGDLSTPSVRAIFPLWDNLRTNQNTTNDDQVLYLFEDTNADSTPDRLIINWRNLHYYSVNAATDDGITFQAVLALNTGALNGGITFNYTDLGEANTQATNNAGGASVGVKGTGSIRQVISQNSSTTSEVATGKAVQVFVNQAPTASAGAGYVLNGSSTVQLSAVASSDPNQTTGSLSFLWDLDADGVFGETGISAVSGNETGMSPIFNAQALTGPALAPIALRVVDNFGLVGTSTTTVTIPAPPTVATFAVNDGIDPQRSQIELLQVVFSSNVTLPQNAATAFALVGPSGSVPFTAVYAAGVATITLANLDDGQYTLTVLPNGITDSIGQQLDGTNATFNFHRLFGDGNGDATVNQADYYLFRNAFLGGPSLAYDYDHNGDVDQLDFDQFRLRYGVTV